MFLLLADLAKGFSSYLSSFSSSFLGEEFNFSISFYELDNYSSDLFELTLGRITVLLTYFLDEFGF